MAEHEVKIIMSFDGPQVIERYTSSKEGERLLIDALKRNATFLRSAYAQGGIIPGSAPAPQMLSRVTYKPELSLLENVLAMIEWCIDTHTSKDRFTSNVAQVFEQWAQVSNGLDLFRRPPPSAPDLAIAMRSAAAAVVQRRIDTSAQYSQRSEHKDRLVIYQQLKRDIESIDLATL